MKNFCLVGLCILPLSLHLHAQGNSKLERDSLRHLQESWPRLKPSTSAQSTPSPKSSRRVRGHFRNYLSALESTRAVLEQAEKSECQKGQLLAVEDLIHRANLEKESLINCTLSCRASELRFQKLHTLLYEFDENVAECLKGAVTRAWLYEKQTQLKARVVMEFDYYSNPSAEEVGVSADSRKDSLIGAGVDFDYRGEGYWTGVAAETGIRFRKDSSNKWPFRLRNEWIYQPSSHAFRVGGVWGRSYPYLRSTMPMEGDLLVNNLAVSGEWKFPLGARSLSLGAQWDKETWSDDLWSRVQFRFVSAFYLVERHRESAQLYLTAAKINLENSGDQTIWATRAGLLFQERRSESETSLLRIGIQDRRSEGAGASLWPEFEVSGVGPDLVLTNFYPSWKLKLEPVETPWSANTLRSMAELGIRFSKHRIDLPFKFGVGRDFHRSALGGLRDDLLFRLSVSPSYQITKKVLLELPLEWQRYWILSSARDPSTVLVPFPQNSYKAYEARLRMKYEF